MTLYFREASQNAKSGRKKAEANTSGRKSDAESPTPVRRCIVCGKRAWKYDLLRVSIVKAARIDEGRGAVNIDSVNIDSVNTDLGDIDNDRVDFELPAVSVFCDFSQQASGRGWYVHSNGACLGAKGFSERLLAAIARVYKGQSGGSRSGDYGLSASRPSFELSAICGNSTEVFSTNVELSEETLSDGKKVSIRAKRKGALEKVEKRTWDVMRLCLPELAKEESLKMKLTGSKKDSGTRIEGPGKKLGRNIRL